MTFKVSFDMVRSMIKSLFHHISTQYWDKKLQSATCHWPLSLTMTWLNSSHPLWPAYGEFYDVRWIIYRIQAVLLQFGVDLFAMYNLYRLPRNMAHTNKPRPWSMVSTLLIGTEINLYFNLGTMLVRQETRSQRNFGHC